MDKPVAGEVEGVDLDLDVLADMDEADVAVRHHRFDLEMAVGRHHDKQRLRRRDDAADGVHRKLLHGAVDRGGQDLELGPLFGLDQILAQSGRLALRFDQFAGEGAAEFGVGLRRVIP